MEATQSTIPNTTLNTLDFAREYFNVIQSSKKVNKKDVVFFFDYYDAMRANKWNILKMLSKEFKVLGLGGVNGYASADKEVDSLAQKKKEPGPIVLNVFQEATVLQLRRCLDFFELASSKNDVRATFPNIDSGIKTFLDLDQIHTLAEFSGHIAIIQNELKELTVTKGGDFVILSDFFGTLASMLDYQDIVDNFPAFKMLLQYPKLTPYMYALDIVTPKTLKKLGAIAKREYDFKDDVDFIVNYFVPMREHFDLCCKGLVLTILSAKSKAKKDPSYAKYVEEKELSEKMELPVWVHLLHWLSYWPVAAIYFVFEIFKAIFCDLRKLTIVVFLFTLLLNAIQFPGKYDVTSLWSIFKIFNKSKWHLFIREFLHVRVHGGLESVVLSLLALLVLAAIYVIPAICAAALFDRFATMFDEFFDWGGTERTFGNLFKACRKRTESLYKEQKDQFVVKCLPGIIVNAVGTFILLIVLILVLVGVILL